MVGPQVIEKLERLVDEVGALQSKLVLLIGAPNAGKTALLHSLAKSKGVTTLNVGAELGGRLASMPQRQRHLQTTTILRELADQHAHVVVSGVVFAMVKAAVYFFTKVL